MVTTARKRALASSHQAAVDFREQIFEEDGVDVGIVWDASMADAVSDVWEPLLRELLDAYDTGIAHIEPENTAAGDRWHAALARAEEALG